MSKKLIVERVLSGEVGALLDRVIVTACNDYSAYSPSLRAIHNSRVRADCINAHMVYRAKELLGSYPGSHFAESNNRTCLILQSDEVDLAVKFKKLDTKLTVSNNHTQTSLSFLQQEPEPEQIVLPDMLKERVNLVAGYTSDEKTNEVNGRFLVCPASASSFSWYIDLSQYAISYNIVELPPREVESGPDKRFVVSSKTNSKVKNEK